MAEYSKSKKGIILIGFFILLFGSFFLFNNFFFPTGKATLSVTTSYEPNSTLEGKIRLSLKDGELIPKDSKVKIIINESSYDYILSELISDKINQGDFYIEGVSLTGSGEGYGIFGKKEVFSEVKFTMKVTNPGETEEEKDKENVQEITGEQVITEVTEENENTQEITGEQLNEAENQAGIINQESPITTSITGEAIASFEFEVEGSVSKDKPFNYNLEPGQKAEIISSSQDVKLSQDENQVVVTTDYSEISEDGFGQEYLGDDFKYNLEMDLTSLNLDVEGGELVVIISYEDIEILSLKTQLNVESEVVSQVPLILQSEKIEDFYLTDEELSTLKYKTGVDKADITKAQKLNDKLIIKFEAGEYWLESSYDISLDNINYQIELDRAKFLKRLTKSFLEEIPKAEDVKGYIGNTNLVTFEEEIEEIEEIEEPANVELEIKEANLENTTEAQ